MAVCRGTRGCSGCEPDQDSGPAVTPVGARLRSTNLKNARRWIGWHFVLGGAPPSSLPFLAVFRRRSTSRPLASAFRSVRVSPACSSPDRQSLTWFPGSFRALPHPKLFCRPPSYITRGPILMFRFYVPADTPPHITTQVRTLRRFALVISHFTQFYRLLPSPSPLIS